jgi:integrase
LEFTRSDQACRSIWLQRWLGHASMTTTAIYLEAMGDEEREIAARMWAD